MTGTPPLVAKARDPFPEAPRSFGVGRRPQGVLLSRPQDGKIAVSEPRGSHPPTPGQVDGQGQERDGGRGPPCVDTGATPVQGAGRAGRSRLQRAARPETPTEMLGIVSDTSRSHARHAAPRERPTGFPLPASVCKAARQPHNAPSSPTDEEAQAPRGTGEARKIALPRQRGAAPTPSRPKSRLFYNVGPKGFLTSFLPPA